MTRFYFNLYKHRNGDRFIIPAHRATDAVQCLMWIPIIGGSVGQFVVDVSDDGSADLPHIKQTCTLGGGSVEVYVVAGPRIDRLIAETFRGSEP